MPSIPMPAHGPGRIPKPLPAEPEPVNALADLLDQHEQTTAFVLKRVSMAAQSYREGNLGEAEYHLVRVGLAIARCHGDAEAAETLAELRLVKIPGASS